jgi:hypothetical protein
LPPAPIVTVHSPAGVGRNGNETAGTGNVHTEDSGCADCAQAGVRSAAVAAQATNIQDKAVRWTSRIF